MNTKAFTLVELLTTIVIIAFIMGIILPSASRISGENKEKMYKEYEKMVAEYAAVSAFKNQAYIPLESLDELDKIKNECQGYVISNHTVNPAQYKAYLSCGDYHTEEYDENKVGEWTSFNVPTCRDLTYNGENQELIQNIRVGDKYVFSFEKDGVKTNIKKNSGTYNVTVKIAHKDIFSWADNTQGDKLIRGCEIKKKTITLKANDILGLRYGESPHFTSPAPEGEISGETALTKPITYTLAKNENGTMTPVEINNSIPVGSYIITPHSEVSNNYQLNIVTGTLTVLQSKFKAGLDNQSATQAGTTEIYELYGKNWYSNSSTTNIITKITLPSKDGYMFDGYYTEKDGKGTLVIDNTGKIILANTSIENDTVYYAKWTACGKGYYCSGGTKTPCPAGTYGKDGVTTGTSQSGACNTCEKGYYCAGVNDRHACGNGKYNDQTGQSTSSACKDISAGCYGSSGTSACPNECTGRTKYSAAGAKECKTVDSGYYTTSCNSSNNRCQGESQCTKGTYCSGGVQSNCSGRTKYTSSDGATSCSTVDTGYYTTGCTGNDKCTGQAQCSAGNYCTGGVSTQCPRYYSSDAGATSCKDISNPSANTWANTDLSNTSIGRSIGTTKICHLGSDAGNGLQQIIYGKTSSFGSSASISGGCATISISASSNPTLYYYLSDGVNNSSTIVVSDFAKYLFYGMEYNYFLYPGSAVSNASDNLGGHVAKNKAVSQVMRFDIGNTALAKYTNLNNTTFVQRLYLGILGRDSINDQGGLAHWVNKLNNEGKSKSDVLSEFINSGEFKGNLSAWGLD